MITPTEFFSQKSNIVIVLYSLPDCFGRINIHGSLNFGFMYMPMSKIMLRKKEEIGKKKIMENQYWIWEWETKFKLNLRFCFRKLEAIQRTDAPSYSMCVWHIIRQLLAMSFRVFRHLHTKCLAKHIILSQ